MNEPIIYEMDFHPINDYERTEHFLQEIGWPIDLQDPTDIKFKIELKRSPVQFLTHADDMGPHNLSITRITRGGILIHVNAIQQLQDAVVFIPMANIVSIST